MIDDTAFSSASVPSWTRTTVVDKHKLSMISLSWRPLDQSKNRNFTYPTSIWCPVVDDPIRSS